MEVSMVVMIDAYVSLDTRGIWFLCLASQSMEYQKLWNL